MKSDVCAIPSSKSCDENTHRENDAELGIVSRTVKDQSSTFCPIEDKLSDENCYNYGLNILFYCFYMFFKKQKIIHGNLVEGRIRGMQGNPFIMKTRSLQWEHDSLQRKQVFPCETVGTGKSCFQYREWVCSVSLWSEQTFSDVFIAQTWISKLKTTNLKW